MGQATYSQVREEFEQRVRNGEFRKVERSDGRAAPQYTTAEMVRLEREIVGLVKNGNESRYESSMLVSPILRIRMEDAHPELSKSQLAAVDDIFLTREKIVGLDGVAGAGKTTTLSVIREGVEAQGYLVEGFAPTSRAAQKLAEAGMKTSTLQHHLTRGERPDIGEKRLFVLDESSLASTRQMHEFLSRLHRNDRVLLVGDVRQHEGVEAGRPFAQLQEAGMHTVKLNEILRQRDPELKEAVEMLARGHVAAAIESLDIQGRVHEVRGREHRIFAIAREYAASPESTLVVSPDNRSRTEINTAIHRELQARGVIDKEEHAIQMLVPRQELTGADRSWAQRYQPNDILHYSRTSKETGIDKGEYARVLAVSGPENTLTVLRGNGDQTTYDPRRQMGVSVYRTEEKTFAVGDRVQFTAPNRELKIANRELGTIEIIASNGAMQLKLDSGRSVEFGVQSFPHLDHGYAVTSHSSQGQTAERVLIHVDTELGAKDLLNHRMAYVSVSRGQWDAQIFTNDREKLAQALSHDVSHKSAFQPEQAISAVPQKIGRSPERALEHGMGYGLGL
jgi:ATP-dependent exoDNAse (exonuclease V) alpha subunit